MDEDLLARQLDALYGVAREDFVDERDRRVRELLDAGHGEEGRALGKARKPTVPAWAVDQLARRESGTVEELLVAGQRLRDAQRRAASGRGADELRTATGRVRDLVSDLRRAGADVIAGSGGSPSGHLEDVERTLFTAAVTPEHHDLLRRGVLDRPLEGSGFGGVEGLLVAPPTKAPADGVPGGGRDAADDEAQEARADEERRRELERREAAERRALRRQRDDLRRSLADQEARVGRAADKAEQLRTRAEAAETARAADAAERDRIAAELEQVEAELGPLGG